MLQILSGLNDETRVRHAGVMFEARKYVFVDLLKWQVPVLDGRYEIDQFDDPHAVYLLLSDASGSHLGSARLLRTTGPHILGSLFPHLCDGDVPTGPRTFEITRFCLDRALRAEARRAVRDTLVTTLADYALGQGITRYTAIAERSWVDQITSFGWSSHRLGREHGEGAAALLALAIDIAPETPMMLAHAGVHADPILVGDLRQAA